MLGIIGAMDEEVAQIKEKMTDVTVTSVAGMDFYQGKLGGKDAVVVRSGIGKVNAGMCSQILADRFHISAIVNTGIAGSLRAEINIGDIVDPQVRMVLSPRIIPTHRLILQSLTILRILPRLRLILQSLTTLRILPRLRLILQSLTTLRQLPRPRPIPQSLTTLRRLLKPRHLPTRRIHQVRRLLLPRDHICLPMAF